MSQKLALSEAAIKRLERALCRVMAARHPDVEWTPKEPKKN